MDESAVLLEALEKQTALIGQLFQGFDKLSGELKRASGYIDQLRQVIKLPPLFPDSPRDGDSFYDDATGVQYYFSSYGYGGEDGSWSVMD
jgi:hypothetical protein